MAKKTKSVSVKENASKTLLSRKKKLFAEMTKEKFDYFMKKIAEI